MGSPHNLCKMECAFFMAFFMLWKRSIFYGTNYALRGCPKVNVWLVVPPKILFYKLQKAYFALRLKRLYDCTYYTVISLLFAFVANKCYLIYLSIFIKPKCAGECWVHRPSSILLKNAFKPQSQLVQRTPGLNYSHSCESPGRYTTWNLQNFINRYKNGGQSVVLFGT